MASPAVAIPNGVATGSSSPSSLNHQNRNDVNATTTTSSSDSPAADNAQSFSSSSSAAASHATPIKRKREASINEGDKQLNHHPDSDPHHLGTSSAAAPANDSDAVKATSATKSVQIAIRDYYQVLER